MCACVWRLDFVSCANALSVVVVVACRASRCVDCEVVLIVVLRDLSCLRMRSWSFLLRCVCMVFLLLLSIMMRVLTWRVCACLVFTIVV